MPSLNPYKGSSRKLVLAIDVGTTFSGVSYAVLEPGIAPEVRTVQRFPGQVSGDAKIPSVIWYAKDRSVYAAGAEAVNDAMVAEAEEEGLVFAEWWKMHLRPTSMLNDATDMQLKPLPKGKTVIDVFSDFLKYLFDCAENYIRESEPNGDNLWDSIKDTYEVILTHPNGWAGMQQSKMREAVTRAGVLPDTTDASERLHFVVEGEASMNYCVGLGMAEASVKAGTSVMVIDAGGGTIDISSYCFKKISPVLLEETSPAECLLQGSTTVNMRAEKLLRSKLANSKYNKNDDFAAMMRSFEWATKRNFKSPNDKSFVKFGTFRDNDKNFGVRAGQLSLNGTEVAQLFDPSIDAILAAVKTQCEESSEKITLAFLVGGFAASKYLFAELKRKIIEAGLGINLSRPESSTNKAVANGALLHYLGGYVAARVARYTYGTTCIVNFNEDDPEHVSREHLVVMRSCGIPGIPDAFSPLLTKGSRTHETQEVSKTYCRKAPHPLFFNIRPEMSVDIICYRGKETSPKWVDKEKDAYSTMCTIQADLSNVDIIPRFGLRGPFFTQDFDVVLTCGKTEMKAYIRWDEDGVDKRGDAQIVYEDDTAKKN